MNVILTENDKNFREIKYLMTRYPLNLTVNGRYCAWMNDAWYVFVVNKPEKDKSFDNFHEAMQYLVEPNK